MRLFITVLSVSSFAGLASALLAVPLGHFDDEVVAPSVADGVSSDEPVVATNLPAALTAGLAQGMIEEARLFTLPAGGEYAIGKKQSYVDLLPFPFSEETIPTEGSFLLVDVDDEEGTALLIWRQTLDAEKTAEVVDRFIQTAAAWTGRSDEVPSMDGYSFDIRDEARFSYELATGLPWWMSSSRTTRFGERTRVDWMRITRHEAR